MLLPSIIETRGKVSFPEFTGERVYMVPFYQQEGLPDTLARWQPTVDAMLEGIVTDQSIYIMIDQGIVQANNTHRRPGLHIDGYWDPGIVSHGGREPHHVPTPRRHRPLPSHTSRQLSPLQWAPVPPRHGSGSLSWQEADFTSPEGIILASSVSAARGFVGMFEGPVGDMGDCSQVNVSNLTELPMLADTIYAGNVCCLHESLPVDEDVVRSLVRLNVPGWTPSG